MTALPVPQQLPRGVRVIARSAMYAAAGIGATLVLWQLAVQSTTNAEFRHVFSPVATFRATTAFASRAFAVHTLASLERVSLGLLLATVIGMPVGVLVGYVKTLHLITNTVFQFGRMTSPLAWTPIALVLFGVGSRPVVFLIAFAAVWPILINTANGVRNVDPTWIRVVQMLGATRWDVLRRAILPAVLPDILVGVRISLGVSWIVLVPAEMLGVSSGLGYYILDARDRLNYSELMALILAVGFFGFVTDTLLEAVQRKLSWRAAGEEEDRA